MQSEITPNVNTSRKIMKGRRKIATQNQVIKLTTERTSSEIQQLYETRQNAVGSKKTRYVYMLKSVLHGDFCCLTLLDHDTLTSF